jgi:hypothetical protein
MSFVAFIVGFLAGYLVRVITYNGWQDADDDAA